MVEDKPSTVTCISIGGYPPPDVVIYVGDRNITSQFSLKHSPELHGVKGLKVMVYRTERWTSRFTPTAKDDGMPLKCVATVAGLAPNISQTQIEVNCEYRLNHSRLKVMIQGHRTHNIDINKERVLRGELYIGRTMYVWI